CTRSWSRPQSGASKTMCHTRCVADLDELADATAGRIEIIASRGSTISRGVALLTTPSVGLAYLVGLLVIPSPGRWVWLVLGLIVCAIPAIAAWTADRRVRQVPHNIDDAADELAAVVVERPVRDAMFDLVDRDEIYDTDAPLFALGREFQPLRDAIAP